MGRVGASTAKLPTHRVDVVEPDVPARRYWTKCEIGKNLKFDTEGLEAYCFANWDVRVFDAFVLAAAVEFCDRTKARRSARWGRDIFLRVPTHDPAHWHSIAVLGALRGGLEFLTGDRWHLEFVARRKAEPPPQQRRLSLPEGAGVIIPFSDGLDSRAVAGLAECEYGHKLIRVRLGSRSFNGHRTGDGYVPFAAVPYRVSYGKKGFLETSVRSRGFKFALLSGIAAYLSQSRLVIVPESGQGALGPVLVPVGQAYEDYRGVIHSSRIVWERSCRPYSAMKSAMSIRAFGTPKPRPPRRSLPPARTVKTGRRRARAGRDNGRYRYPASGANAAFVPPACSDA